MGLVETDHTMKELSQGEDTSLNVDASYNEAAPVVRQFSEEETKRILRKIDYVLLPWLAWLYLLCYLDRGNIGNAKVAGMSEDLNLTGMRYNVASMVFFIPYCLLAIPSNVVLKLTRASIWMTVLVFSWGLIMTLTGLVKSYQGLAVARFFLGIPEAGFLPAANYLLTLFYKRYEVLTRMAIFYTCSALAGAFSGLLAYAIQQMDGVGGLGGWRWIFIIEGLLPIATSFILWRFLPDGPMNARFLTPEERVFIQARIEEDTGTEQGRITQDEKLKWSHIVASFKEWKTSAAVVIAWGNSICAYGFTFTVPSVILGLGYSSANAQLLTIPIYFVAAVAIIGFAMLSDKYHVRSLFIAIGYGGGAIAMLALLVIPHPDLPGLTYGFLFLAAAGMFCPLQVLMSWLANNIAPSSKRAVALAQILMLSNLGGFAGSNIFLQREAPHYWLGYGFCLGILVAAILMTLFLRYHYAKLNRQRDAMTQEEIQEKYTEQDLLELGDLSPYFRYTL